ncbi:MAG: hypothetical protein ACTHPS_18465 [Streptosporangiaceae bacterium]
MAVAGAAAHVRVPDVGGRGGRRGDRRHVGHINSNITRAVYRHQLGDEIGEATAVFDSLDGATS